MKKVPNKGTQTGEKDILNNSDIFIARRQSKTIKKTWQLPTLPEASSSTIGVRAFYLRVRDGNVYFHSAMVTRIFMNSLNTLNESHQYFQ